MSVSFRTYVDLLLALSGLVALIGVIVVVFATAVLLIIGLARDINNESRRDTTRGEQTNEPDAKPTGAAVSAADVTDAAIRLRIVGQQALSADDPTNALERLRRLGFADPEVAIATSSLMSATNHGASAKARSLAAGLADAVMTGQPDRKRAHR